MCGILKEKARRRQASSVNDRITDEIHFEIRLICMFQNLRSCSDQLKVDGLSAKLPNMYLCEYVWRDGLASPTRE